jgi:hypothetical protein
MNGAAPIQAGTFSPNSTQAHVHWSIARLLRERYPYVSLRAKVLNHRLLEQVTLACLLDDPTRVEEFLEVFRSLPQCGSKQVATMREVLVSEIRSAELIGPSALHCLQSQVTPANAPIRTASAQPHPTPHEFFGDFADSADDVYFRMWRLAQFDPFVYLPTTLPEFAKTPEVLAAELKPGRDLTAYLQRLAGLRRALDSIGQAEGLILLDGQALEAIFLRQGRYAELSREAVEQQARMLRQTLLKLPPGVSCKVCDIEVSGLSSGAFVGNKGVLRVMGGYIVFENPRLLKSLLARFRTATAQGRPLADFLEEIC